MSPNLRRLLTVADRRLAVVAETKTNLKTRFLELTRLREQAGKRQHLLANPRNKTRGRSPRQFGNNEARLSGTSSRPSARMAPASLLVLRISGARTGAAGTRYFEPDARFFANFWDGSESPKSAQTGRPLELSLAGLFAGARH